MVVEASLASVDEVRCLSPDLSLIYPQLNTSTLMNASLLPMGPPPSTPPPPMPPASPPPNTTNITTSSTATADAPSGLPSEANGTFWSVPVCVTLNGDPYHACAGGVSFEYYHPQRAGVISRIYPVAGPIAGGTGISLWGSGFRDLDPSGEASGVPGGLMCAFGNGTARQLVPAARVVEASGEEEQEGRLLCTSPPVAKEAAGTVAVRVVLNGDADVLHELTESVEFRYFAL